MSLTLAPRVITATEQALLRRDGQWSELYCAIDPAPIVFRAEIDSSPASNDQVAILSVVNETWAAGYTTAHAGMTIWVGTEPGQSNLGCVRLRTTFSVGTYDYTVEIGETSEIDWTSDIGTRFLTIVDEFRIWPRLVRTIGPITVTPSATASGTQGTLKVFGGTAFNQVLVSSDGSTTLTGPGNGFLSNFAAGDWLRIVATSGLLYREIDHVVNDATLVLTQAVGQTLASRVAQAIKTHFARDVKPGYTITIGTETHTVLSVQSGMELTVDAAWDESQSGAYILSWLDIYMDYDETVSDILGHRHYLYPSPPVPVLGAPIVIDLPLDDLAATPHIVQLDASRSYAIDDTVSTFLWYTTGGTLSSTTISAPTLTLNAAGTTRVSARVGGSQSIMSFGHRKIYAFDRNHEPFRVFRLDSCSGDVGSGGWSARLTVMGTVDRTQVRDQAQVVLFARDHYGATAQAIGQVAASANLVMVGWIVGETIEVDPELGTVSFEIQGPQYWLDRITGVATAMEDVNREPVLWTEMYHLTVDRALWHFFVWRTTVTLVTDVHLTGDTRPLKFLEGKLGTLSSQVEQIASQVILARSCADRLGRVIVELDPQLIPAASRLTPVVQHLEAQDWRGRISLARRVVNEVARLTLSGVSWNSSTQAAAAFIATAPGKVFKTHGRIDSITNLAIANQDQADRLAALALANRNNPYPSVTLPLAALNRLLDVAPAMYVTLDLPADRNPRGLDLTQFPVLVRRVTYSHDPESGVFLIDVQGEGYTDETTRLEGPAPQLPFVFGT